MTTTITGVFFVGKDRPGRPAVSEHKSDAGEFVLKMRLIDNQGPRTVEVYVARWSGPAAAAGARSTATSRPATRCAWC